MASLHDTSVSFFCNSLQKNVKGTVVKSLPDGRLQCEFNHLDFVIRKTLHESSVCFQPDFQRVRIPSNEAGIDVQDQLQPAEEIEEMDPDVGLMDELMQKWAEREQRNQPAWMLGGVEEERERKQKDYEIGAGHPTGELSNARSRLSVSAESAQSNKTVTLTGMQTRKPDPSRDGSGPQKQDSGRDGPRPHLLRPQGLSSSSK